MTQDKIVFNSSIQKKGKIFFWQNLIGGDVYPIHNFDKTTNDNSSILSTPKNKPAMISEYIVVDND